MEARDSSGNDVGRPPRYSMSNSPSKHMFTMSGEKPNPFIFEVRADQNTELSRYVLCVCV